MQVQSQIDVDRKAINDFFGQATILLFWLGFASFSSGFRTGLVIMVPILGCIYISRGMRYQAAGTGWGKGLVTLGFVLAIASALYWISYFANPNIPLPR